MFDFLRNLTKSAEEKRQEALNAYLDDALTPRQRRQFEQALSQDAGLQSELDDLRFFKQQLRQLPQRRVPRNFTLDPAVYAPPAKQPLFQFYPVLQGATVLTAFFFVVVVALGMFNPASNEATVAVAPAAESGIVAQGSDAVEADMAAEEETMAEMAEEEEMMEEEAADEEVMEEAAETMEAQATAVFQVESEVMSETTSDEPMEEAAAEEAEEVMEDTATGELSSDEGALSEDEAATSESEEPALPATGGAANQVTTATPESTIFPSATATVSVLPRVATATAVPDRILPTDTPSATATAVPPSDNDGSFTSSDFNLYQQDDGQRAEFSVPPPQPPARPNNTLRTIQITLGILLLAFGLTTFLVRRKM